MPLKPVLLSLGCSTGFKGVSFDSSQAKPFVATGHRDNHVFFLGSFSTAEEAALCVARELAANDAGQSSAPGPPPAPMPNEVKLEEAPPPMPEGASVVHNHITLQ